jgi:hypothetical protein
MIGDIARTGDRRKTLEAMRDKLADDMDQAPPAVVAQIAARLQSVLDDLEKLGDQKVSVLDELANRRTDRLAAAGVPDTASRSKGKRRTGSD